MEESWWWRLELPACLNASLVLLQVMWLPPTHKAATVQAGVLQFRIKLHSPALAAAVPLPRRTWRRPHLQWQNRKLWFTPHGILLLKAANSTLGETPNSGITKKFILCVKIKSALNSSASEFKFQRNYAVLKTKLLFEYICVLRGFPRENPVTLNSLK